MSSQKSYISSLNLLWRLLEYFIALLNNWYVYLIHKKPIQLIIQKVLNKWYFIHFFLYQDQVAKFKRNPPPSPNIQFHGFLKIYIIRHYQTSFDRIRKDICTNIVDKIRNRILNLHSKKWKYQGIKVHYCNTIF